MRAKEWLALDPDEEIRWSGRPRILTTVSTSLVLTIAAVIAAAMAYWFEPWYWWLLALIAVVSVSGSVWFVIRTMQTEFVITDRACYKKTGVFSLRVQRLSLDRIQDTSLRTGVTGRLFGHGTVRISVAGGHVPTDTNDLALAIGYGGMSFTYIDDPERAYTLLNRSMRIESEHEIPGTTEQWTAIRDELRTLRSSLECGKTLAQPEGERREFR